MRGGPRTVNNHRQGKEEVQCWCCGGGQASPPARTFACPPPQPASTRVINTRGALDKRGGHMQQAGSDGSWVGRWPATDGRMAGGSVPPAPRSHHAGRRLAPRAEAQQQRHAGKTPSHPAARPQPSARPKQGGQRAAGAAPGARAATHGSGDGLWRAACAMGDPWHPRQRHPGRGRGNGEADRKESPIHQHAPAQPNPKTDPARPAPQPQGARVVRASPTADATQARR
jgi:hypothetical protein